MARLLVKAIDAINSDPLKDAMCYKKGDIVCAMPDKHEWGKLEGPPKFIQIDLPGEDPLWFYKEGYCSGTTFRRDKRIQRNYVDSAVLSSGETGKVAITKVQFEVVAESK